MNSLVKKVASILPDLEGRGTVYLFALAERVDSGWKDIVFSSEWSDKDWSGTIGVIIDLLWPLLNLNEKVMIAQIAVVASSDPRMQEAHGELGEVALADNTVVYVSLLGSDVRRAFIFKAQHPPIAPATTPELTVAHA